MNSNTVLIVSDSISVALALKRFFAYVSSCNVEVFKDKDLIINAIIPQLRNSNLVILAFYQQSSLWLKLLYEIRCKVRYRGTCVFLSLDEDIEKDHPLIFKTFMKSHHKYFPFLDVKEWKSENILDANHKLVVLPGLSYTKLRRAQRNIRWTYKPVPGHSKINYAGKGDK